LEALISVVVPIFNKAEYLPKCLNSITGQTYKNLEIICVDDGSTDGSLEIINEYRKRDSRIIVIKKENGGATSARKAGVKAASGSYIGCVDADDWVDPNMYELLLDYALRFNVDIVTCGYCLEGNYTTFHEDTVEEGLYDGNKIQYLRDNTIYRQGYRTTGIRGSLCCKLFEAELFKEIQLKMPDELTLAEDKMCLLSFMLEANSAYVLKKPLYHWVIHNESMSHAKKTDYLIRIQHVYEYLHKISNHPNFTEKMRNQSDIYVIEILFLGINKQMGLHNENLLWINPAWMESIPANSTIVLYGGGVLGEKYLTQARILRPDIRIVGCVDSNYKDVRCGDLEVFSTDLLDQIKYDFVLITIKNPDKALECREKMIKSGIVDTKIFWFDQPEMYWKYIDAEGLN